jgi:hypothetical protein
MEKSVYFWICMGIQFEKIVFSLVPMILILIILKVQNLLYIVSSFANELQ